MKDLLLITKDFLLANTQFQTIAITDHVELLPVEGGYPAIGIFDGGDQVIPGASEGIRKHLVFLAAYSLQVGSRESAVIEVRSIIESLIPLLENYENFYRDAAFAGYNGCMYIKSSESKPMIYTQHDETKNYVAIKIARFEFTQIILNIR